MIAVGPFGIARRESPVPFYQRLNTIKVYGEEQIFLVRIWWWTLFLRWPFRFFGRWLKLARYQLDRIKSHVKPIELWLTGHQSRYYVNVYAVDRCWGGAEEGGWWWTSYIPFEELPRYSWGCDTIEEARIVKEWLTGTLTDYQPSRNRYSIIGGPDIEAIIEEHTPMVQPTSRPHYE